MSDLLKANSDLKENISNVQMYSKRFLYNPKEIQEFKPKNVDVYLDIPDKLRSISRFQYTKNELLAICPNFKNLPMKKVSNAQNQKKSAIKSKCIKKNAGFERISTFINLEKYKSGAISKLKNPFLKKNLLDEPTKARQTARSILNKLTEANFDKMKTDFISIKVTIPKTLEILAKQIFEKSISEPERASLYALFCYKVANRLPKFEVNSHYIRFRDILLEHCNTLIYNLRKEIDFSEFDKEEALIKEEIHKKKNLGNMVFIGELFKLNGLKIDTIQKCLDILCNVSDPCEYEIECMNVLLLTIGEKLEREAKEDLVIHMEKLKRLSEYQEDQIQNDKILNSKKLSSRIRFLIHDIIDLQRQGWKHKQIETKANVEKQKGSDNTISDKEFKNEKDKKYSSEDKISDFEGDQKIVSKNKRNRFRMTENQYGNKKHEYKKEFSQDVRFNGNLTRSKITNCPKFNNPILHRNIYNYSTDEKKSNLQHQSQNHFFDNKLLDKKDGNVIILKSFEKQKALVNEEVHHKHFIIEVVKTFLEIFDIDQLKTEIKNNIPENLYTDLVYFLMLNSIKRNLKDRNIICNVFEVLCRENVLSKECLTNGLVKFFIDINDFVSSCPNVELFLAFVMSHLMIRSILTFDDVFSIFDLSVHESTQKNKSIDERLLINSMNFVFIELNKFHFKNSENLSNFVKPFIINFNQKFPHFGIKRLKYALELSDDMNNVASIL